MLRSLYRHRPLIPQLDLHGRQAAAARAYSSRAPQSNEEQIATARKWLNSFDPETIPKSICEVSFSRSSGPGGQNVNKVSSKATLRVPLGALLARIPAIIHPAIRSSRYYAPNSDSLVIQADDSRKQNDNTHACYTKLYNLITESGRQVVPGETSEEQRKRVKGLQHAQNEGRLRAKKTHSLKKSNRRGGGGDF